MLNIVIFVVAALGGGACLVMTVRDARSREDTDQDAHSRLDRGHRYEELPLSETQDAMAIWPQLAVACFIVAIVALVL